MERKVAAINEVNLRAKDRKKIFKKVLREIFLSLREREVLSLKMT